jgi:hypothetical protein
MASSAQVGDVWFIDMIVFTLSTRWEGARGAHRVHECGVVVVEPESPNQRFQVQHDFDKLATPEGLGRMPVEGTAGCVWPTLRTWRRVVSR